MSWEKCGSKRGQTAGVSRVQSPEEMPWGLFSEGRILLVRESAPQRDIAEGHGA